MFTKPTKDGDAAPAATPKMDKPPQNQNRGANMKGANGGRAMASIVGADMILKGSIKAEGSLQVDGKVEGDIVANDITIGASGSVEGQISAEVISVKGRVKGSIKSRKVELESGAHVQGDIIHASLQIQPNAVFEGQVKHSKDPLQSQPAAQTAAPAQRGVSSGPTPQPKK